MIHPLRPLIFSLVSIGFFADGESVTYSRGDRNAYLKARGADQTHVHHPSKLKVTRGLLKEPPNEVDPSLNYDDPRECTLYLAESSIPNAGLGMYTTVPYDSYQQIGHSELGIMMHDLRYHYPEARASKDLYMNYVWGADALAYGGFEADKGAAMIPGLGMMINDHPGLNNVISDTKLSIAMYWKDGDDSFSVEASNHDTKDDLGRGASSSHSGLKFRATKRVEAGEELFISYGSGYFESRDKSVPQKEHYKEAFNTLTQFMTKAKSDGLDSNSIEFQQRYDKRIFKADWLKERPKLKAALPENASDIPIVMKIGTAAFSVLNKKRSVSWIKENGVCIDNNMIDGATTIPQANRGAFATRSMKKGAKIMTTPVITFTLQQLTLREAILGPDWNDYFVHAGYQQILNYCYGHKDSTLLFFPAVSTVNFVNHGNKKMANAEVRWSTSSHHRADWLNVPLDEMKTELNSGLFFDIVSTKDIKRGDEILLYYGEDWEASWDLHIGNFGDKNNFTEMVGVPTAQYFNQKEEHSVLRTVFEQETNPYPDHLMTTCFFVPPESCESQLETSTGVKCEVRSNYTGLGRIQSKVCDILSRHSIEGDVHWYTANVTLTNNNRVDQNRETEYYLVDYLPRDAIRFVHKPYTKDQYRKGAFRRPIGIGENMMPEQWMDLRRKVNAKDDEL